MPRLSSVLVIDSDSKGLEALTYGFESEGVKTAGASSAEAAQRLLREAREARPQVVIATAREPGDEALALLQALAGAEDTRDLPRLLLAPAPLEAGAEAELRAAGTAVLPLPTFARDVITAARLIACTTLGADDAPELRGMLSDYGLFYFARTMIGLGRSGIVQLERANRKGEVRFADGEIVGAQVGSLQGQAALHHLLLWEEAALDVKFRGGVQRGPGFPKSESLLDDMERFMRDFAHAIKDLGPLQALFVQDAEAIANQPEPTRAEVMPVLVCFDGQRTLGEVLEDSPFRAFDTLRIVTRLVEMGAIRRKAIEKPSAPAVGQTFAGDQSDDDDDTDDARNDSKDQRMGPANRRKNARKTTAGFGTLAAQGQTTNGAAGHTPEAVPVVASSAAPVAVEARPASAEPAAPAAPVGESKSGEMKARGEFRATKRELPAQTEAQPSMVIDLGPAEGIDASVAAEPATNGGPAPNARSTGVHSAELAMGGRPSRSLPTPAAGPSIQLDPNLAAELTALDEPRAPAPSPSVPAVTVPVVVPVVPSAAAPVSFVRNQVTPAPTPPPAADAGARTQRPSGEFNALEADFFAREADLYKHDKAESFDDLDRGPGRRGPGRR
jgi:CheY-like chemotaxis protein